MSIGLKSGKTHKLSPYDEINTTKTVSGAEVSSLYGVVKRFLKFDAAEKIAIYFVDFFKDEASSNDSDIPTIDEPKRIKCSGTDFDTYFDDTVLKQDQKSLCKSAYLYLHSLSEWNNFEGDE